MTRKEAIEILHNIQADNLNLDDAYTKDKYDALDMAIRELEQEPMVEIDLYSLIKQKYIEREVLDKIRAEIQTIIGERNLDDYDFCSGLIVARKIIDKYRK